MQEYKFLFILTFFFTSVFIVSPSQKFILNKQSLKKTNLLPVFYKLIYRPEMLVIIGCTELKIIILFLSTLKRHDLSIYTQTIVWESVRKVLPFFPCTRFQQTAARAGKGSKEH